MFINKKLSKKAQEIFGMSIQMILLIILLVVVIGIILVFKTNLFNGLNILK